MNEGPRVEAGTWWRFDRYEIRDGSVGPARGAVLQAYDPWAEYELSRERGSGQAEAPYQSFARLASEVTFRVGWELRPTSARAITDWCARFGLLGILPQFHDVLPAGEFGGSPWQERYSHVWQGGEWWHVQSALPWVFRDGHEVRVATAAAFAKYFPECGPCEEDYPNLPEPLSEEFWAAYREPLEDFMWQAKYMSDALLWLSTIPAEVFLADQEREDPEEVPAIRRDDGSWTIDFRANDFFRGQSHLNDLTATVAPVLHAAEVGARAAITERWVFRSLLASLAMMAHRDLVSGARLHVCTHCGSPFPSVNPRAAYCSVRCRNTAQKRRQRHPELRVRKGELK